MAHGQVSSQRHDGTERQSMSFSLFSSRLCRGGKGGGGGLKTEGVEGEERKEKRKADGRRNESGGGRTVSRFSSG